MILSYYNAIRAAGQVQNEGSEEPTTPNVTTRLIAELGQSNMEGRYGDTANPSYPFQSSNGYWFDGTTQYDIVTNRGDSLEGSHANYFCERYFTLSGEKAVMLEAASGGSGLTPTSNTGNNWSSSDNLRSDAQTLINQALTYYSETTPFAALWCQGERDAQEMDDNPSYTKAMVKAAMQDVIDWWQGLYPTAPFIISETGDFATSDNTQGWQDMRAVQNEIAAENANVYIGFNNAKNFGAQGKMGDSLHYSWEGYKEMGEALADFVFSL